MVKICAIRNCGRIPRKRSCHRLPFHNPALLRLWLSLLGLDRNTPVEVLREADHRVCALHFKYEDYVESTGARNREKCPKKSYLKRTAVPTLGMGPTLDDQGGWAPILDDQEVMGPMLDDQGGYVDDGDLGVATSTKDDRSAASHPYRPTSFSRGHVLILSSPQQATTQPSTRPSLSRSRALPPLWDLPTSPQTEQSQRLEFSMTSVNEDCNDPVDSSFQLPSSTSSPGSSSTRTQSDHPVEWDEQKWAVNESSLMALFRSCHKCGIPLSRKDKKVTTDGSQIKVVWRCLNGHQDQWSSCPDTRGIRPAELPGSKLDSFAEVELTIDSEENMEEEEEEAESTEESETEWEMDEDEESEEEMDEEEEPAEEMDEVKKKKKDRHDRRKVIVKRDQKRPETLCTNCGQLYKTLSHKCDPKRKFQCPDCGFFLLNQLSLNVHRNGHCSTRCQPCVFCFKPFKTRQDRLTHEMSHSGGMPYECPECPERFKNRSTRNRHLKEHQRSFRCQICQKEFPDLFKLHRHEMSHSTDKPFKCEVCDRVFTQASQLKSHLRVHTGEKPFQCQLCPKCFNHNISLKNHIRRYHQGEIHDNPAPAPREQGEDDHSPAPAPRKQDHSPAPAPRKQGEDDHSPEPDADAGAEQDRVEGKEMKDCTPQKQADVTF